MTPDINLAVLIPSRGDWKADFGQSLAMACMATANLLPDDKTLGIRLCNHKGSLLSVLRTELVRQALNAGATHLLFLDDDMVFPMDAFARLLAHDVPVVAANCATKVMPPAPTAKGLDGKPLFTRHDSRGLEAVQRVGTGVMMIRRDVFERVPEPWFAIPYDEATKGYIGEDVFFCNRVRKAGIPIYVDHDLSKQITHQGNFDYAHHFMEEWHGQETE